MSDTFPAAALEALIRAESPALMNTWMDRLRADPTCRPSELVDELAVRSEPVLETLADALSVTPLHLSADHFRALVRELSFVGGWLAGRGASASLAVHYVVTLGRVLRQRVAASEEAWALWLELEHGLVALVMETYCHSLRSDAAQRLQELLEQASPVIRLPGDVPALLVVGAPERAVLSSLCGRLLVEVVRLGARAAVLDFTHCTGLPERGWSVLVDLLQHRKTAAVRLVLCNVPTELRRHLRREIEPEREVGFVESWEDALRTI